MRRSVTNLSLVALLGLGACVADERLAPHLVSLQGPATQLVASSATGRHMVSFSGSGPADFEAQVTTLGGSVVWSSPDAGLAAVSGLSASAAATLAKASGISQVDEDLGIALDLPTLDVALEVAPDQPASQAAPATAFFFPRQWNMRAVQADAAWAGGHLGSPSVSVFILDSGIDYGHADLAGLVDQSRSVDMLGTFNIGGVPFTEADTVAKYFPTKQPFTDLFFHGTHVAATVASNALAAAGVTSRTTLVAVKVCAYLNTCPFSAIAGGVIYAADHGADVVNMSLGGNFGKAGNGRFVGFINKIFNYARSKGVTVVVSAGNSAIDMDHDGNAYKTYCSTPSTICVAATGPTARASVNGPFLNIDDPAYYTNFGRSAINVAAPGGNSSLVPVPPGFTPNNFVYAACSQTSRDPGLAICATGIFIVGAQGTSMAAPHVTGTAALLVAQLGRNPAAIKAAIEQSADDLGQVGTDPFYGKGRLNTARALGVIP